MLATRCGAVLYGQDFSDHVHLCPWSEYSPKYFTFPLHETQVCIIRHLNATGIQMDPIIIVSYYYYNSHSFVIDFTKCRLSDFRFGVVDMMSYYLYIPMTYVIVQIDFFFRKILVLIYRYYYF